MNPTSYDTNNVFAKIVRGEIPCKKIFENDHVLAFEDIQPQRVIHFLLIPKKPFADLNDFAATADDALCVAFWRAAAHIAKEHHLDEKGWRLIINCGEHGRQEVPHVHAHIIGGEDVGAMLTPSSS